MAEKKKGFGTPFVILSFVLVFFILFDFPKGIRDGTAILAGFVFQPLIGFGGRTPLVTIFLSSVLLVIVTTAIRHFLVDWTKMARVQEAMRAYTSEMRDARKSNNTYKLKKLTDAQQDVMQLQAEVQTEQMKPMAFTMLLVIPIFAWLGLFVSVPVTFDAQDAPSDNFLLVGLDGIDVFTAGVLGPGGGSLTTTRDVHAYPLALDGASSAEAVRFKSDRTGKGFELSTAGAQPLPRAAVIAEIPAGTYNASYFITPELRLTSEGRVDQVHRVLLVVDQADGWATAVATSGNVTLSTTGGTLYAIVTSDFPAANLSGSSLVTVGDASYPVGPENFVTFDADDAAIVLAYETRVPWNPRWSYQEGAWLFRWHTPFAHWIALYSLFGIPFGQIAQRALKLWEYRHVDLDADGIPAGRNE